MHEALAMQCPVSREIYTTSVLPKDYKLGSNIFGVKCKDFQFKKVRHALLTLPDLLERRTGYSILFISS